MLFIFFKVPDLVHPPTHSLSTASFPSTQSNHPPTHLPRTVPALVPPHHRPPLLLALLRRHLLDGPLLRRHELLRACHHVRILLPHCGEDVAQVDPRLHHHRLPDIPNGTYVPLPPTNLPTHPTNPPNPPNQSTHPTQPNPPTHQPTHQKRKPTNSSTHPPSFPSRSSVSGSASPPASTSKPTNSTHPPTHPATTVNENSSTHPPTHPPTSLLGRRCLDLHRILLLPPNRRRQLQGQAPKRLRGRPYVWVRTSSTTHPPTYSLID